MYVLYSLLRINFSGEKTDWSTLNQRIVKRLIGSTADFAGSLDKTDVSLHLLGTQIQFLLYDEKISWFRAANQCHQPFKLTGMRFFNCCNTLNNIHIERYFLTCVYRHVM